MLSTDLSHYIVPEIGRHFACYVATETVDADGIHPPVHGFLHLSAHVLVVVVEFGDIGPVVLHHEVAEAIAVVPAFVLGPLAIWSGVVSYPVKDNLQTQLVCLCEEVLKVSTCTKLRVEFAVVSDGIVATQCTLALEHANLLDRHNPDDIHATLFDFWQECLCSCKSTFWSSLTGVEFVDCSVVCPACVASIAWLFCTGDHSQCSECENQDFFHCFVCL